MSGTPFPCRTGLSVSPPLPRETALTPKAQGTLDPAAIGLGLEEEEARRRPRRSRARARGAERIKRQATGHLPRHTAPQRQGGRLSRLGGRLP